MRGNHIVGWAATLIVVASSVAAVGQSNSPPISFDSELERLDAPKPGDVEPRDEDVPAWKQGSWGADLRRWAKQDTQMAEEKEKAELAAIKQKCDGVWNNRKSGGFSGLVLTSKKADARGIAYNRCINRGGNVNACIYRETDKIERQRAREAREKARLKRQRERQAAQTREYCNTVKADVLAGRVPSSIQPSAYSAADEATFEKISASIDANLKRRLAENDESYAKIRQAEREAEARKLALEEASVQARGSSEARKKSQEKICQAYISQEQYPCSCSQFFPPGVTRCGK